MSKGMLGRKIGMTSVFDGAGNQIPCTVIEASPNVVTQVRTAEKDGYEAVQLSYGERKVKRTTKAMQGHFEKAGTTPKRHVREFSLEGAEYEAGSEVRVDEMFEAGERIDVAGTSKGKGFQGVVKRHGFAGVGDRTHGQHNRQRAPGSIGAASTPSRVIKGMKMGGQTGNERVTMQNLEVVQVLGDKNAILVRGAVPGPKGSLVELRKR